jgi:hypothetical protein
MLGNLLLRPCLTLHFNLVFEKKKISSSYFLMFLNHFYILISKLNFKKLKNIYYFDAFPSKKQFKK